MTENKRRVLESRLVRLGQREARHLRAASMDTTSDIEFRAHITAARHAKSLARALRNRLLSR